MGDISQQLVEQVRQAAEADTPLAITGGGSKPFLGRGLRGEPLELVGHAGIVSYEPVELVLTVRAGTRLDDIDAALAEQGQRLAFEPPRFGSSDTIGGALAANLSGPGRPWQGSVRDHVLGLRLINGRGEHLRFGGQVMKNVAGYDASRLQAGALGTLGAITEISLKVMPRPAMEQTLIQPMDHQHALALMNRLAGQSKPLSAACWYQGQLYLRLSGSRPAVEATSESWRADSGGDMGVLDDGDIFWRQLRDQRLPFFDGEKPLWRFSVNPTATLEDVDEHALIDWGGAQRWSRQQENLSVMAEKAARAGGQAALFRHGDRSGEVMHPQPAPLRTIQKRLKASFDPEGIFNPQHLYTWL
ncbi:glycolate oxidase subunit GlcE [Marinobacter zhanjiangensis]|uniref:Glycolate oxidase subunit GlcE n=1 Tax=Marinobacter zhanjiangensis TaxID=578215 RepID=A0ABQ3B612_9GAMM|nr:glycolate oxidase subunit GlcE [Marinobacter zhanjiangensis]GGY80547.1 glycolate oxidase subunit GlcE [Marinobacter zhanjiangensis]